MEARIMVVGIGGVGGYLSAMLAKYYKNVTLVARNDRYTSLVKNGLTLHSELNGDFNVKVHVEQKAENAGKQDFIFICVKNYSLLDVLQDISPCIDDNTIIVPVMNGVDHGQICEKVLNKGIVVDALIYIVSYYNHDYTINQQGDYAYLYVGGKHDKENQMVCDLLNDAQIDCALAEDIEVQLWKKYILNCAFNILTAYYDCTNTEIRASKVRCNEYKALLQEAYDVARAKGVLLNNNLVDELYDHFFYKQSDGATSSLERDISSHKKSELETYSGYLINEAQKVNISVPQTKFFYQELLRKSI